MASDRRMDPALYEAATQGEVSSLRQLLEKDPTILVATTPQLNTALHLAALHGHADFAAVALEEIADQIVARNNDGDTPLHVAARTGKLEVTELLVRSALQRLPDEKSPLIMTNKTGNSPLHEAVWHHRGAVAVALLDADPARAYDFNEQMESPLDMAAREGLVGVVRKIVDYTFVEQEFLPSVSFSGTALHQAVLGGHIKVVEILLDKLPELIDRTDFDGNNALHFAAQKNDRHAVEILLNKKTEMAYQCNSNRQSALHVAVQYGSTDAIKVLLRHCPDMAEMVESNGHNAFHTSVANGKLNALRCLLNLIRPAELLNHIDYNGKTPLHLAAQMSRVASALMLLKDSRVDPCVRDREGQTARSLVELKLHRDGVTAYEMYLWEQLKQQESKWGRKQQLPPLITPGRRAYNDKYFEHIVERYILVAALIATVTFAATFNMPGSYDQIRGTALHRHSTAFKIFVVSNTIALCTSSVVVFCFIWAWHDPVKFKVEQLLWGLRLTALACLGMLLSLITAVYITVPPDARWPAYVVFAIGASTPAVVFRIVSLY